MYYVLNVIRLFKLRKVRWEWHVACMGQNRNVYAVLVRKPEGDGLLRRTRHGRDDSNGIPPKLCKP
jgi:hypothetical protein